jgi:hypothetical protein
MNERIKELADQAGHYVNETYKPPVRSKTPGKIWEDGHIDWHTQFNQKFAELIVLECNYLIQQQVSLKYKDGWEQYGLSDDWAGGHYAAAALSRTVIKQHFGVKE